MHIMWQIFEMSGMNWNQHSGGESGQTASSLLIPDAQ